MINTLFNLKEQIAVVTGGSGVLGGCMAKALAQEGVKVAIMSRRADACEKVARDISANGGLAIAVPCDTLNQANLEQAAEKIHHEFGLVDILINAAGGNSAAGMVPQGGNLWDLKLEGIDDVLKLNFQGTLYPTYVFARDMVHKKRGNIINIASMASYKPLTRVIAYAAAKSAIVNLTMWLSVHMAREFSPNIRVNAIAPGFFLGDQNRHLLIDAQSGEPTPRGKAVLNITPMSRFGEPEELLTTMFWMLAPGSSFITGVTVPIDGGVQAFHGV